jgi:hypothetical protein
MRPKLSLERLLTLKANGVHDLMGGITAQTCGKKAVWPDSGFAPTIEARARIGMLGSQRLLADRQCPLVKSRNHLVDQIESFRIGDKDNKREDDLLDTFCYGTAIGLGNSEGF